MVIYFALGYPRFVLSIKLGEFPRSAGGVAANEDQAKARL
jgi:hypothetical protein